MALVCTTYRNNTSLDGPGRHHFIGTVQVSARNPLHGLGAVAFLT